MSKEEISEKHVVVLIIFPNKYLNEVILMTTAIILLYWSYMHSIFQEMSGDHTHSYL